MLAGARKVERLGMCSSVPLAAWYPDGDALSYSWDFGDGTAPVLGFQVPHAFSARGTYSVTLTVSDGSLSNTKTIQAYIR